MDNVIHISSKDDPQLKEELCGQKLKGSGKKADLERKNFRDATFFNLDFRGANLKKADLFKVEILKADFRGTDMTGIENLHTVIGLDNAKFNDDTIVKDIDLELIARNNPLLAHRLKRIRYNNDLKQNTPIIYFIWQLLCGCGRSWIRLFIWGVLLTVLFWPYILFGCKKS